MDTSTGLPLAIKMKVAATCGAKLNAVGMVNLITAVQTKVAGADAAHTFSGLGQGAEYEVVVRDDETGAVSEPQTMRTAAGCGSRWGPGTRTHC